MSQYPNGYFLDPDQILELTRLIGQATTASRLAGRKPFPEGVDPYDFHAVLDVACGPGDWVMDVAYYYPEIEALGIDISQRMIAYARARARSQGLQNALFSQGDATQPLEHAGDFDYVNGRFLIGFLRRHQWSALLSECNRVLKPGGCICLTEGEWPISNSPAYQKYTRSLSEAFKQDGLGFSIDGLDLAITPMLGKLLRDAGFTALSHSMRAVELSYGTQEHINWFLNCRSLFLQAQPFLLHHVKNVTAEELDELYHQVMIEMQQESFCSIGFYLSVVAYK